MSAALAAKKKKKKASAEDAAPPARERARPAKKPADGAFTRWAPWVAAGAVIIGIGVWQAYPAGRALPEDLVVRVLASHPHDTSAFTQGLVYAGGKLYESTGLYGHSELREVDLESGDVRRRAELDEAIFAEGLAAAGDLLFQLSWREGTALVWRARDFRRVREVEYTGEGWGLCHDGQRFIMSSGSDRLQLRDTDTFEKTGEVRVTRAGRRLRHLNELECVDGAVYANIWTEDHIARIDPETGDVTAWIDASDLLDEDDRTGREDVLNGIAYIPDSGHFLLTGKRWPKIYEVVFETRE